MPRWLICLDMSRHAGQALTASLTRLCPLWPSFILYLAQHGQALSFLADKGLRRQAMTCIAWPEVQGRELANSESDSYKSKAGQCGVEPAAKNEVIWHNAASAASAGHSTGVPQLLQVQHSSRSSGRHQLRATSGAVCRGWKCSKADQHIHCRQHLLHAAIPD